MNSKTVICLMGPTATGKTDIAVRLHRIMPVDIVSVDSALVYRGLNIGTAKPTSNVLAIAPHRLIDIRDPEQRYSAGDFVSDARREIDTIHRKGRVPLLVGGTMLYFRSLVEGLAALPPADAKIRQRLDAEARERGWPHMHRRLAEIDSVAAQRIDQNDSQRIQRALEVFEISGKTLSAWHEEPLRGDPDYRFIKLALIPGDRAALHALIEERLDNMLHAGFVEEVRALMQRPGLSSGNASMKAVGYRQFWAHLEGRYGYQEAVHKTLVATRQLAKRQMTWLRAEKQLGVFEALEVDPFGAISAQVTKQMDERRHFSDN